MDFWIVPRSEVMTHDVRCGRLDGEPVVSVVDVLRGLCDVSQDHAAQIWRRIKKSHPEDTAGVRTMKFPGKRQRVTDVATEAKIYQICMLAPGTRAAQYRVRVAVLLQRAMQGDESLIQELKARQEVLSGRPRPEKPQKLLRGPERENSISIVKQLQGMINKMCGGADPNVYREVFRPNMVSIKGMEPHTIAELYGIPRNRVRDILSPEENVAISFLELSQLRTLESVFSQGTSGKFAVVASCNQVRSNFADSALSMLKVSILPMKTYEVYVGLRARTEGRDQVEEIPYQGGVICSTSSLEKGAEAARVMYELALAMSDPRKGATPG